MRHLLTIAMLCGLGVSTATAQSVVIVDKEGVQHKFATERVKEITFTLETPVQPVVPLEFPSAEVEPGDDGEALLMFIDDESGKIMTLEVFGSADATFLEEGQYTVTDTREPFTINSNFANIMEGINGCLINGGSMNVRDFSGSYSIEFDFTLSDGSAFIGSYNGPLPGYSSSDPKGSNGYVLAAASTCRQVDINNPADGEFYLKLNDENWTYEAVLDLFAPAGSTTLPDGYYEFSENGEPYTFGPKTNVEIYTPYSNEKIVGGLITVSTTYTGGKSVTLNGTTAEGKSVKLAFEGDIEYLPAKEIQTFDLPAASNCKESDIRDPQDGEFYLKLNDTDWTYEAVFDLFAGAGVTKLPDGEYTYSDSGAAFTFGPKTGVEIYQPYSNEKITGGRITVTTNGDGTQTLTLNGTSADGNVVNLTFSGNVEYLDVPLPEPEVTALPVATDCKQADIRDPQDGEFYLKLNDASWSYEAVLDLFAGAGATELPDGEYTYSDSGAAFTFGPKTGVEIYQPYSNEKLTGGTITLSTTATGRKIEVNGLTADGVKITFVFEGTIAYI